MFVAFLVGWQVHASFFFNDLDERLKGPLRNGYGLVRAIQKDHFDRVARALDDPTYNRVELLAQGLMAAHLMNAPDAVLYLVQNVREMRSILIEEYVKASLNCDSRITTRWRPFVAAFGEERRTHARIWAELDRLDLLNVRHTHQAPPITIFQVPHPGTFGACYQIPKAWPYRFDDYAGLRPLTQMPPEHYRAWVDAAARYRAPDLEISAAR